MVDEKKSQRFKATTPTKRFLKLAGMSANIAKNVATSKVKNLFSDADEKQKQQDSLYADIGKQIAETLGEMKGAVMKVGQIASQMKEMLPKEVASALEVLQKESPPMPFAIIRGQVIKALGDSPENLFKEFDPKPFAAASIGQVHRAVTKEGVDCVVKIQYPGVKESCQSDLKHLKRALKLVGLIRVSADVLDKTFAEIQNLLMEELDYYHEAKNITLFNQYYHNHPYVIIPELIESLSAETVLTLTYVPGDSLQDVKPPLYSQDTINLLGYHLFETFGEQIYDLHLVHSDPHPGNFAFRPDGSIVIYDFGAVKRVSDDTIVKLRKLVCDAFDGNIQSLDQDLVDIGVRTANTKPLSDQFYGEWLDIFIDPFRSDAPYDFAQSNIHKRMVEKLKKDGLKYIGAFQPSPDTMLVDRVISGHYWTIVELGVNIAFRPLIDKIVLQKSV